MFRKIAAVTLFGLFAAPLWAAECSIDVHANDQIQYDTNAINVDRGCTTFTVNLIHTGQLAKNVMGHNWVLTTANDMTGVLADGAGAGLDNNYLKPGDSRVIAHTKVIGGGEKDSASFDVARLKGGEQYMFFCSYPGHSALMKGTLSLK